MDIKKHHEAISIIALPIFRSIIDSHFLSRVVADGIVAGGGGRDTAQEVERAGELTG